MILNIITNFDYSCWFASLLPSLPLDSLFSTQGIMVMLLMAYGGAMWMFLRSAPQVYTIMVSDLAIARDFYEGLLNLPVAEIPLHYYYNYEQTLGISAIDASYLASNPSIATPRGLQGHEGLWYQLKKNTQLHIIAGAHLGPKNNQRHVCFDQKCLADILLRIQARRLKYKIRTNRPLNFLVKDLEDRIIEMTETAPK